MCVSHLFHALGRGTGPVAGWLLNSEHDIVSKLNVQLNVTDSEGRFEVRGTQ